MASDLIVIAAVMVGALFLTGFVNSIIKPTGLWRKLSELLFLSLGASLLVYMDTIQVFAAIIAISAALFVDASMVLYKNHQSKKALSGGYGEEVKWASELIEDGDELFVIAVNSIDQTEMKEIGIIAESKQELRNLTIERFDEQTDGGIPQEFL